MTLRDQYIQLRGEYEALTRIVDMLRSQPPFYGGYIERAIERGTTERLLSSIQAEAARVKHLCLKVSQTLQTSRDLHASSRPDEHVLRAGLDDLDELGL
jgi:hypothetical protein